ncbi:ATP-dependent nuclease [Streptomyces erythrochromogenes]|uniref:ATP-dependent nuclease n=1 Tax=Streptomyces erythrochromogenes TaxID=285574 RepID=UPI003676A16A
MHFDVQADQLVPTRKGPPGQCVLIPDKWNDRGYLTTYDLWYRPSRDEATLLGRVKIARVNQERGRYPLRAGSFEALRPIGNLSPTDQHKVPQWFSLGQDEAYYDNIRALGDQVKHEILDGLADLAYSPKLLKRAMSQEVTKVSLLRGIELQTVTTQFSRIAHGGPRLTPYDFAYMEYPTTPDVERLVLSFTVTPHSTPSTNIHVLIGSNGVGKTTLLRRIAQAAVEPPSRSSPATIAHAPSPGASPGAPFINVVSVSFSAFDPFTGLLHDPSKNAVTRHVYVGLADPDSEAGEPKSRRMLTEEFTSSVRKIFETDRAQLWMETLDALRADRHFTDSGIHRFARDLRIMRAHGVSFKAGDAHAARAIFRPLSSGHAIVLLTLTRLVEQTAEQSLVLLDEPEAHLHPPLLSSFLKAFSNLLTDRNAVAIIASHSPVVLQEVPRACVWKLSRFETLHAERPEIETYGENVGILTHEVFGLEARTSGFHSDIERAVARSSTYEEVLARFGGQLGGEARGIVRILLAKNAAGGKH